MDPSTAFWYAAGMLALLILLQVLAKPLEAVLQLAGSTLIGGLALWVLNLIGGLFGIHLALNPASAVIVGVLGLPGVVSLGIVRLLLG